MSHTHALSSSNAAHIESTCHAHGLTPDEFHELHRQSVAAKARAYCRYSNFPVGTALLTRYGRYVQGANVENASYPVGTCAERVAFGTAIVEGHRDFKAIAVATDVDAPCSPCGMCRQFIREFCELDIPILMFAKNGDFLALRLEVLLPLSFGADALRGVSA